MECVRDYPQMYALLLGESAFVVERLRRVRIQVIDPSQFVKWTCLLNISFLFFYDSSDKKKLIDREVA